LEYEWRKSAGEGGGVLAPRRGEDVAVMPG
jgi:hypothetical protein